MMSHRGRGCPSHAATVGPGPSVSPLDPVPAVMLQQGWSLAPHCPGWDGSMSPPSLGLSLWSCPMLRIEADLVPPGRLLLVGVVDGPWMSDPALPPHMESYNSGFWFPIPKGVAGFYNALTCSSACTWDF